MLGELDAAYQLYQRFFRDPGQPLDTRRKAALQAGGCAERLGDVSRACAAYGWFRQNGSPDDPLTLRALSRLEKLCPETAERQPEAGLDAGPEAGFRAGERLQGILDGRLAALDAARRAVGRQQALDAAIERISLRLRGAGIELGWEEPLPDRGAAGGPPEAIDDFLRSLDLDARDAELLREELAHRFYLRGLMALSARDLRGALDAFGVEQALAPGRTDGAELAGALKEILGLANGLGERAQVRIAAERRRRQAEVEFQMAEALREAQSLLGLQETQQALEEVLLVKQREDWCPPGLKQDARLREYSQEAARHWKSILSRAAAVDFPGASTALRRDVEGGAAEIARLVEAALAGWPPPWVRLQPRLEDPALMLPRLRSEVHRGLALLESEPPAASAEAAAGSPIGTPAGTAAGSAAEDLADTLLILEWFPELDPTQRDRARLQRALGR